MTENTRQRQIVLAIMQDGKYRTLFELERELRNRGRTYLSTSISARLRELRNPKFGGWIVDRRKREGATGRTQEYAIRRAQPQQQQLFRSVA